MNDAPKPPTAAPVIDLGYVPRPYQAELHRLAHRHRFLVPICHRRFGKTVLWLRHAIDAACRNERTDPPPRYSYVAPYREQAKTIAWEYLKAFARPLPGFVANESELRVDWMGGRRIRLFGADNYNALRGQYNDGVGLDEMGQIAPVVLDEVIMPTLSDFNGWAMITGTPAGRNHFYKLKQDIEAGLKGPEWATVTYKASQTGIIAPAELELQRRAMGQEKYEQEYECSFDAAIRGAYYADEIRQAREEGRLMDSIPVERIPTGFAFDLGMGDDTSIWVFQLVGREIRVLAYYSNNGVGLDHYVAWLEKWRTKHHVPNWMSNNQLFPHDINVRELGTGRSRLETLRTMGLQPRALPISRVEDGINAARMIFPRCVFDVSQCRYGLDALSSYRRDYDDKKQIFHDRPLHDWASHGADAFRVLAQGVTDGPGKKYREKIPYSNRGFV